MTTQTVTARRPATRLPATRERRPLLAVLAVLLILLGAAGAGYAALANGAKTQFLVVKSAITQGSQIRSSDLVQRPLSGDTGGFIPAYKEPSVVGKYAATGLASGQVITDGAVTSASPLSQGLELAPVQPLKLPSGLSDGDTVKMYRTPTSETGSVTLLGTATVISISVPTGQAASSGADAPSVSLSVSSSVAGSVVAASAANALSITKVAPGSSTKKSK